MKLSIQATWYRGLRQVRWEPEGVSVLVGQNGAGKTTLLQIPLLFAEAQFLEDYPLLERVGGIWGAVHIHAPPATSAMLSLGIGELVYRASVSSQGRVRLELEPRKGQGSLSVAAPLALLLRQVVPGEPLKQEIEFLESLLAGYRVYGLYGLTALRSRGSSQSSDQTLLADGSNVFSLLRNWRDSSDDEERFEFVSAGLRQAFPGQFSRFHFESAQTVVFASFVDPAGTRVPARAVSEGMLTTLLHLCAVASAPDGGMVAIDEPENSLSPFAIRQVIQTIRERAAQKDLTVLLATHSPVLLNQFKDAPEDVWVLDLDHEETPRRLTDLHDEDWLARFSLGDLYAREVVGAPGAAKSAGP